MKKVLTLLSVLVLVVGMTLSASAVKLVVWESPGPEEEFIQEMGKIYTEQTGVEIEVQPVDQINQDDKLALDGPAGKGADIVVWPHDGIGRSVEQGLIWPIPEDKVDTSAFTESSLNALTYKGKLYGLPYAVESVALLYNKDLLPEVPETFDEFLAKVKELNKPAEGQFGFMANIGDLYHVFGFISGYGGYIFKQTENGLDINDIGLDSPGAIKAMKFIKSFRTSGLMPEGTTGDVMNGLFSQGSLAAVIDGLWALEGYREAGVNFGVAPLPRLDNGEYPHTFIGVKGYYISAFSEHKEEALKFIQWLTTKENSFKHYQKTYVIPPRKDVMEMPEFKENKVVEAFAIQASRGMPMPNVPEMMAVWEPANNALSFILQDQVTPEEAAKLCVQRIQDNIEMMKE
ncbi:maltodextrin ABC transporter substrate-binding protein [Halothermothrix orenii]|uniref:Maltodextrin-binding protein n=1 Tax=Halothermothrix orenii (strain H 168 / OCM 544 / DSM 9562) TaxID=373903 RepID=B8CYJ9_HALOH|nr:maltodextrin ABC transporter substrate-binding protein [Halothermothrix orenii]ACL70368.1 extracellular solute-binding protein family 1 [Halothermothrix orenii H 168]